MKKFNKAMFAVALSVTAIWMPSNAAQAESINEALALAYSENPTLNAQRAATRAVDEGVPIAKSGYRPSIFANADVGASRTETRSPFGTTSTSLTPYGFGVSISQNLWDSYKTANNVSAAKAGVLASRETLRNTEQNVLFNAATAYMDVIRDSRIASFRRQSLAFLDEQVRSENARFEVGESTRTDVAQARARQAQAQALLNVAMGNLESSKAVYRQIIGKQPGKLKSPKGVGSRLPANMNSGLSLALAEHPAIRATEHLVDQAAFNVKSSESDLLPTVTLNGSVSRGYDRSSQAFRSDNAQITANLNVPIYQGGRVSGQIRQNKERLGEARIRVDESVDSVRASVVSAYSQLQAAQASLAANRTQRQAAELALSGAVEERRVGQRTTLDVLDTQQDVIEAQIAAAQSERDVIVAGYAVLSSVGRLNARRLGLKVAHYEPKEHFNQVKDKWFGLRTPDAQK